MLITGSSDHTVIAWSMTTFEVLFSLIGHQAGVLDVAFDEQWICSAGKDSTIRSWHRTGALRGQQYRVMQGHRGPVNAMAVQNGKLASAAGDGQAKCVATARV